MKKVRDIYEEEELDPNRVFCSRTCSARGQNKPYKKCENCSKKVKRHQSLFCSLKCFNQNKFLHKNPYLPEKSVNYLKKKLKKHAVDDQINRAERRRRLKRQCIEFLGGTCQMCGLREECEAIYDFDHTDEQKKSGISSMLNRRMSIKRNFIDVALKKELKKCRLLCRNCHSKHHYEENRNSRISGENIFKQHKYVGAPHNTKRRKKISSLLNKGYSIISIAKHCNTSRSNIYGYIARMRIDGELQL